MTATCFYKVCAILSVLISIKPALSADPTFNTNLSKYKFGYVISHKGGSSQARLESRDGNLALGRYYVNLPSGSGQKVTYFADDLGVQTGVSYSSRTGKGSSKTQIAMGYKGLAAFGDFDKPQSNIITASTVTPQFGSKILSTGFSTGTSKPTPYLKLNYTPVPGGFYLTHEPIEQSKGSTKPPNYVPAISSKSFASEKYSAGVPQSKANTETFFPSSGNVKNEINQLYIQSTTPSIKTYTSVSQQGSTVSGSTDGTLPFSHDSQTVKVSPYVGDPENLSYFEQKSIEKTNFAEIDARLISEVQKHAQEIIMKDIQKEQNLQNDFSRFSPGVQQLTTVTMQPIVVTGGNELGITNIVSTTAVPEVNKYNKDFQTGSINSIQVTEKSNSDQLLEDSGYFRVSLSPSLTSSINVSQPPRQLIDAKFTNRNSNDSTLCESNLCEKYSNQEFPNNLGSVTKEIDELDPLQADISSSSGTSKITQAFYPKNEISKESHYVTTIDVQKGISLDVQQNEDGSIQLASNFPFNKLTPYQNRFAKPTPQPPLLNSVSVTPRLFTPAPNPNIFSTPQKPYVLNAVTLSPGLFDAAPNQNLAILQGYNDVLPGQNGYAPNVQDRIENQRLSYENQLVPPAQQIPGPSNPSVSQNTNNLVLTQEADLQQVEKNIQELRQQILSNIDAQHEEEERRQKLVDEERKQYFENLKKVEALKEQNSISYNQGIDSQSEANIQATVSPVTVTAVTNSVELVPQTQYVQTNQITGQQNDLKDYRNQIPVVYSNIQTTSSPIYQKQTVTYSPQEFQTTGGRQGNQYGQYLRNGNLYVDNSGQQTATAYDSQKVQLNNYVQQAVANNLQARYGPTQAVPQVEEKNTEEQVDLLQLNTVPVKVDGFNFGAQALSQENKEVGKTVLVNPVVSFDYGRAFQVKQPVSLLPTYSVSSSPVISSIYSLPQQFILPGLIPQNINFQYPSVPSVQLREYAYSGVLPNVGLNKQYHSTLTQLPKNKLRIQPLKPSSVSDETTQGASQNALLSQPPFQQAYFFQNFPLINRLHLRHVQKNKISNSDQVAAQSVRRAKSLKNLRIEYGFKPPLRPSVEFSEEVKPSIYGPSVPPQ